VHLIMFVTHSMMNHCNQYLSNYEPLMEDWNWFWFAPFPSSPKIFEPLKDCEPFYRSVDSAKGKQSRGSNQTDGCGGAFIRSRKLNTMCWNQLLFYILLSQYFNINVLFYHVPMKHISRYVYTWSFVPTPF